MRYTKFERAILECVDAARGMPRHCAKHALSHLDRAWKLKKRDPEMAIFRAITAEEEAATAIFSSLSRRWSRAHVKWGMSVKSGGDHGWNADRQGHPHEH